MRQFSTGGLLAFSRGCAVFGSVSLLLSACDKGETRSYSVPKEAPRASAPPANSSMPMAAASQAPAPIQWTVPAGWEEQPPGGMRVGSFIAQKAGQKVDISVIPLGGISGTEIDNVNRWRGQVGLGPVDAAQLGALGEKAAIGDVPATLYDMAGTDSQAKQPARIVASSLSTNGTTWFFKMTGPDALVTEQKPAFVEFLKSVQFEAPAGHGTMLQAAAPVSTNPSDPHASPAEKDKPSWDVPAGWQEQPPSSMRVATFLVSGGDGATADLSVIRLGGPAGGTLANVNRWRAQVGLQPVDDAELQKLTTTRQIGGTSVLFVEMAGRSVESGDPARLIAAIVPKGTATWFYKLFGNDALVAKQKDAFMKFVESARYPNVS